MEEININSYWRKINKCELLKSAKVVLDFVEDLPGDSYWINEEDGPCSADIGYTVEFLRDLVKYLEKKLSNG